MIGRYGSSCGCGGPGKATEAGLGIPGGYFQQLPPEGVAYETPHASMAQPVEPLVPMPQPPSVVPIPDNTVPPVIPAVSPPPSSVITQSYPPPTVIKESYNTATIAVTPLAQQQIATASSGTSSQNTMPLLSGYGFGGYGDPIGYGAVFGKADAQKKCDKFKAELQNAQAGIGKGIFGWFGGQGIFGNRENVLQGKIEKWCGKAMQEAEAFATADAMYQQAVATGDVAMEQAVQGALDEQKAADQQAQLLAAAGIGLAAMGLIGVFVFTSGGRRRR